MGSFAAMRSKYRAVSRSAPTARRTGVPGSGGTYVSGSTRVVITSADSKVWAGSTPSAMRNTSEPNRAPSCTARISVTMPDSRTTSPSGIARSVTTTSSSCSHCPGATPTRNTMGVASSLPRTRPTGSWFHRRGTIPRGCARVRRWRRHDVGDASVARPARRPARGYGPSSRRASGRTSGQAGQGGTAGTDGPRPAHRRRAAARRRPGQPGLGPHPAVPASASRRSPCRPATRWPCTRRPPPSPPSPASPCCSWPGACAGASAGRGPPPSSCWRWSAGAHILKGLDVEEAALSLGAVVVPRRHPAPLPGAHRPGVGAPGHRHAARRRRRRRRRRHDRRADLQPPHGLDAAAGRRERAPRGRLLDHHRRPPRHHPHHRPGRRRHRAGASRSAGCSCGRCSPREPGAEVSLDARPRHPRPPRRRHAVVLRAARRQAPPAHRRHPRRLRRAQRRVPRVARSDRPAGRAGRRVVGLPRPRHPPGLERGRAGAPARRGCRSTQPAACRTATSATRPSWTPRRSRSTAAP